MSIRIHPTAEVAANEVLSLPVHPALSQVELDMIIKAVNEFMNSKP